MSVDNKQNQFKFLYFSHSFLVDFIRINYMIMINLIILKLIYILQ